MLRPIVAVPSAVAGLPGRAMASTAARAIDYASYLTPVSMSRKPSPIRALQPLVTLPGMISLGGGMPNPKLFPVSGISFTFSDGAKVDVPPADVSAALQYSPTPGLPELVERLARIQSGEHNCPSPVAIAVTPGSQDGLAKLFDALVTAGDSIIVEGPTYSGTLAFLEPLGCKIATVPTDTSGLQPEALAALLRGWDVARDGKKPRVLYTIPTGSNPTGASLTLERKRAIYEIAREHGLLIVEDDPYYYLQYSDKRTPSFLSLDVDGRVVRTDSFSKILSAGIRVGFVTGPAELVERICLHNQASIMHNSGLSQTLVLALLRHWRAGEKEAAGADALGPAFEAHLARVQRFYAAQCDAFFAAADRHLRANADGSGDALAEYGRPSAGMFVWLKLRGVADTSDLIMREAVKAKVLLVPGGAFFPGAPPTPFVRAAFSTATAAEMEEAMQRLGALLRAKLSAAA